MISYHLLPAAFILDLVLGDPFSFIGSGGTATTVGGVYFYRGTAPGRASLQER